MSRKNRELDEEIRTHLALEIQRRIDAGETREAAEAGAQRDFGNLGLVKEVTRSMWGWSLFERIGQDLRYGVRALRRNPAFTLIAVLSLALGIGANTAIFSVLNVVLLKPMQVTAPEELYRIQQESRVPVAQRFSYHDFERLRDAAVPESVAAMSSNARVSVAVGSGAQAEPANAQLVSGEFFAVLGVAPVLGRALAAFDNLTPGGHPVAVVSHGYWKQRLGGEAGVLGRNILLNGVRFTIVGVAPPGFHGVFLEAPTDFWIPVMMQQEVRYHQNYSDRNNADGEQPWVPQEGISWLDVMVRAGPNSKAAMLTALNIAYQRRLAAMAESIGDPQQRRLFLEQRLWLESFAQGRSSLRTRFTPHLFALMGMVALVLLIACANTANLMLARASARQREIAVRLSIGAGRGRLIQQLLTESFVLVAVAASIGLLLAYWSANALVGSVVNRVSGQNPAMLAVDGRVLGFTLVLSVVTGLLFGLAPALRSTKLQLGEALKTSSRSLPGRSRFNPGKFLVAAQVALALLLVVGAGLFARSLYHLGRVELGFDRDHVLSVSIDPRASGFTLEQLPALHARIIGAVSAIPGVEAAAVAMCGLASECRSSSDGILITGYTPSAGEQVVFQENRVSPRYFSTVGMRLLRGRDFDARDRHGAAKVALVNQALTRRYFANREAIGQRFGYTSPDTEIIGIITDARVNNVREQATPMAYYSLDQEEVHTRTLEVRAAGDPARVSAGVRKAIAAAAPDLAVERITTLSQQVGNSLSAERLVTVLTAVFGSLALGLACFGLYGVMSYALARRTTEIGVRMALGARPSAVLWAVLRESLGLILAGLAAGLPVAMFAARFLSRVLYGVQPWDSLTLWGAVLTLASVAILAALVPAWRAARVDPCVALRQE
jgi:predicted permease